MAKRNRRSTRGRKKPLKRGRRKTSRASVARRGVTVTMTMAELKKYLSGSKKKSKKKSKSKRSSRERDLATLRRLLGEDAKPKKVSHRPAGTQISSASCSKCGSMQYEKDEGGYTHFYCPECDRWTKAILA